VTWSLDPFTIRVSQFRKHELFSAASRAAHRGPFAELKGFGVVHTSNYEILLQLRLADRQDSEGQLLPSEKLSSRHMTSFSSRTWSLNPCRLAIKEFQNWCSRRWSGGFELYQSKDGWPTQSESFLEIQEERRWMGNNAGFSQTSRTVAWKMLRQEIPVYLSPHRSDEILDLMVQFGAIYHNRAHRA